jgi:hypothetical protein
MSENNLKARQGQPSNQSVPASIEEKTNNHTSSYNARIRECCRILRGRIWMIGFSSSCMDAGAHTHSFKPEPHFVL